jgi:hypothetical protein
MYRDFSHHRKHLKGADLMAFVGKTEKLLMVFFCACKWAYKPKSNKVPTKKFCMIVLCAARAW